MLVPLAMRSSVATDPFPTGALTLELTTLVIAGLALSVASARFVPEGMGGIAAGPILLGLVAAAHYLPERLAVFILDPQAPRWHAAHDVWRVLLLIAIAALLFVSRDPWRRSLRSFGGSVRPRPRPP